MVGLILLICYWHDIAINIPKTLATCLKRKQKHSASRDTKEDEPSQGSWGGEKGIHQVNPHKNDFDFDCGAEYRAKVCTLEGDLTMHVQSWNRRQEVAMAADILTWWHNKYTMPCSIVGSTNRVPLRWWWNEATNYNSSVAVHARSYKSVCLCNV